MVAKKVVISAEDFEGRPIAFRNTVRKSVRNNWCQVNFIKADGSKRKMECTLMPTFLPAMPKLSKKELAAKKEAPISKTHMKVWDTDKMAWRAFRFDTIVNLVIM